MKVEHSRRAWADISLQALKDNSAFVSRQAPGQSITAVVKANGYGHGMEQVARTLSDSSCSVECFAVATMDEVVALNTLVTGKRIVLLPGFKNLEELAYLAEAGVEFVIHADYQLAILKRFFLDKNPNRKISVWLKLNTGMNRLGMSEIAFRDAYEFLCTSGKIQRLVLMSHLACADASDNSMAATKTERQISLFESVKVKLAPSAGTEVTASLAASAGIFNWPSSHYDNVRPGIMLYGGSPLQGKTGFSLGLQPVMTLRSSVIAINEAGSGETIGYGATYTCDSVTRIGVVGIGYADGYPRSAGTGTPVLVQTDGQYHRTRLLGRVSMDMITIDLTGLDNAEVGDEVVLWGQGLSADEVASHAETISYELFCRVSERVRFNYY